VQGTGEKQERQHAIHKGRAKIDASDKSPHRAAKLKVGRHRIHRDHGNRGDRSHDGQPYGVRQTEKAMIDIPKHRREDDKNGGNVDCCH